MYFTIRSFEYLGHKGTVTNGLRLKTIRPENKFNKFNILPKICWTLWFCWKRPLVLKSTAWLGFMVWNATDGDFGTCFQNLFLVFPAQVNVLFCQFDNLYKNSFFFKMLNFFSEKFIILCYVDLKKYMFYRYD